LDVEPISCEFLKRTEWQGVMDDPGGATKFGRYHQSVWHEVKQFGSKRWVVGCYILCGKNIQALMEQGSTEEEIVQGCIKFLNQPPPRKKYQRKKRKPLYGNLDPLPVRYNFNMVREGEKVIMLLFATDARKNKYFWGEGPKQ